MKNKFFAFILSIVTVISLITGSITYVSADNGSNAVSEAQSLVDGIVSYKMKASGASSIQAWINGGLTNTAGTNAEWYILGLAQSGNYNFSSYESGLKNYLNNNTVYSATSRQKYALCFIATGSADSYISSVMEDSIGNQGVMSWVYGLHLLNNGYTSSKTSAAGAKQTLLSLQLADGGWAIMGNNSDVDVTSMAIQALAPYYYSDSSVKSAIDRALNLLSAKQLSEGDFSSYGVPNPESTAQVLTALSCLGINFINDSRFIKNGNTLLDGINKFKLSDGSFCHKLGEGANENATVQVYYSMVAYLRMVRGQGSLYILDKRNPSALAPIVTEAPDNNTGSNDSTGDTSGTGQGGSTNNNTSNNNQQNQNNQGSSGNQQTGSGDNNQSDDESGRNSTDAPEATVKPEESAKPTETPRPTPTASKNVATDAPEIEETPELEDIVEDRVDDIDDNEVKSSGISYKLWASIGIIVVAIGTALILYLKGKRNKKNFIIIAGIAVLAVLFVCFTDFQSADAYYNGEDSVKEDVTGTVSFSIRCDTIVGKSDSEYIPYDGVILDTTEFEIQENDTVYDILVEAAKKYEIQMENSGSDGMVYISGINYLYEFDFGDLSGWMYFVNDEEPSLGCDSYVLKDGDNIEWHYTCELGNDL